MYKVIVSFKDLQDGGYVYRVGDTYPREGITPKKERVAQLSSASNKRGVPLIKGVPPAQEGTEKASKRVPPGVDTPAKQKAKERPRKSRDD